ncbi:radical SAM protein [Cellulomonas sp. P24]|nr:radical SAM protein [Cellulomonas sp. P24]
MSPALPDGEPAPEDGALPAMVVDGAATRDFGVYLHVPFCTVRCGYCDFNTYTATELGGGASRDAYASTALREIALGGEVMRRAGLPDRPAATVFVGGGTPTVLPVADLAMLLDGVRDTWGLADDAEVTTEANPDSVGPDELEGLAAAGFTRVSFGMQSAVPHVLATLERTHDPRRVPDVVRWARDVGLAVSLDLIYGTPGESVDDWRASVEAALATGVDHVSAYALVVEPGTRMATQVRRGSSPCPPRTTRPSSTRSPTTCSPTRVCTGTRSATGRGRRRTRAGTTSPTGGARTGGVSDPVPTATSAGCAGGTSSTRVRTRRGSRTG